MCKGVRVEVYELGTRINVCMCVCDCEGERASMDVSVGVPLGAQSAGTGGGAEPAQCGGPGCCPTHRSPSPQLHSLWKVSLKLSSASTLLHTGASTSISCSRSTN